MTPNSTTTIRLDELNKILNEMQQGEAAVKRLAEMDSTRGIQDPVEIAKRHRGKQDAPPITNAPQGVLGDNQLANNLRMQATRMANEAKGLLAESDRLLKEAAQMDGVSLEATVDATPIKRGRGRPAKAKVTT